MCVALEIITSPYITIAAAAKSNAKSIRRRSRLLSEEKIAKSFTSAYALCIKARIAFSVDMKNFLPMIIFFATSNDTCYNRAVNAKKIFMEASLCDMFILPCSAKQKAVSE